MTYKYDVRITDFAISENELSATLADGRKVSAPLRMFPRLLQATEAQRLDWSLTETGAVKWEELGFLDINDLLHHGSPIVRALASGPFGDEFLLDLDTATQGMWFNTRGFTFATSKNEWPDGISEDKIQRAESIAGFKFPDDFRLFLRNLHDPNGTFFPWGRVTKQMLSKKLETVISGFIFDVDESGFWPTSWGDRPNRKKVRDQKVREELSKWPRIIPIVGNRYLLAEPLQSGNAVISINQSDVIYYGPDLGRFLCNNFMRVGAFSWIDSWRWMPTPSRPEFGPWDEIATGTLQVVGRSEL